MYALIFPLGGLLKTEEQKSAKHSIVEQTGDTSDLTEGHEKKRNEGKNIKPKHSIDYF